MFSNHQNINILTSLLIQHRVNDAVVCPGSRNAPIVQNLRAAGLRCIPVTDERSAAFYALGIAVALARPVVVCVTSGSAVLNLLPAIAEAAYRHAPVIAITADRPAERIGQLDGQTLPQAAALAPYVAAAVDIPEPHDTDTHIMCNRLVNEALITATRFPGAPVQINVQLADPLMDSKVPRLPRERVIRDVCPALAVPATAADLIAERMAHAKCPMVIVGQAPRSQALSDALLLLGRSIPTLYEALASDYGGVPFEAVLEQYADWPVLQPDFVLYAGETLVSKRLKHFIKKNHLCETWAISADGAVHDTFRNLTGVIHGDLTQILPVLAARVTNISGVNEYRDAWRNALSDARAGVKPFHGYATPDTSDALAVMHFEQMLPADAIVHYANSTAVRLANRFGRHYAYVNRGVNGIEGSLSTAAGHSLVTGQNVYCVIGDLSFFYDSNALWSSDLACNLRILLLNNGRGEIFDTLPGMPDDAAGRRAIMGTHATSAEGLCASYDVVYRGLALSLDTDHAQLDAALDWLINAPSIRPVLLEINTK